jgi:hypothetical protein
MSVVLPMPLSPPLNEVERAVREALAAAIKHQDRQTHDELAAIARRMDREREAHK